IRAIPASAEVSPKSVLSKSAAEAQDMGMKPAGVVTNFQKGGWTFYRTDFTTQIISGQLLQSYITTQAKGPNEGGSGEVLLFSILTDSKDALRQMTDGISPAAKQSQQPSEDSPRGHRRRKEKATADRAFHEQKISHFLVDQISRFFTSSAFSSMNLRRDSTSSPISVVKIFSVSAISSSFTCSKVRRSGSIVVSHSCGDVISPSPL